MAHSIYGRKPNILLLAAIVAAAAFAWFWAPTQFRPVAIGVGALAIAGMVWTAGMQRRLAR